MKQPEPYEEQPKWYELYLPLILLAIVSIILVILILGWWKYILIIIGVAFALTIVIAGSFYTDNIRSQRKEHNIS